MMNQVQHELMHYGVLGMHWGKHKAEAKAWGKEVGIQAKNNLRHPILGAKAARASQIATLKTGTRKDKLRRALLYQNTNDLKDINARTAGLIAAKNSEIKKVKIKNMDGKKVALGKSIVRGMLLGTAAGMATMLVTKNEKAGQVASNAVFGVSVMDSRKKYYANQAKKK